ncbi:hypothetical protein AB0O07_12070 [Streptomyces sp. NPDC093085]|uniref:hypothetical protein n=1 Tax=Streptomyces sp. NPDC093085 TaxID=3155068 RepID=UPI0034337757
MAEHDANREPQPIDEEAAWAAIVAGYGEEPADPPGTKPFRSVEDMAGLESDRKGGGSGGGSGTEPTDPPGPADRPSLLKPAGPGATGDAGAAGTTGDGGSDGDGADDAGQRAEEKPEAKREDKPEDRIEGRSGGPAGGRSEGPAGSRTGSAASGAADASGAAEGAEKDAGPGESALGGSITFAPGVGGVGIALPAGGGGGPRDYRLAEPGDGDTADEEGHFIPPEPPPLPESDVTSRFAWLAVIGGPVLMLLAVILGWDMTWWLTTVCVGGFLGGFATLVARMDPDDDESDDPGRGAVV